MPFFDAKTFDVDSIAQKDVKSNSSFRPTKHIGKMLNKVTNKSFNSFLFYGIISSINKNLEGYSVMGDFIVAIALVMVSLFLFILSIRSFLEKGFLFNNAYIYASKKERETMNKKPYYRQTAIVFFLIGITFLLIGFAILFDAGWITYIAGVVIIIILIYAIISSIAIEKSKKQR